MAVSMTQFLDSMGWISNEHPAESSADSDDDDVPLTRRSNDDHFGQWRKAVLGPPSPPRVMVPRLLLPGSSSGGATLGSASPPPVGRSGLHAKRKPKLRQRPSQGVKSERSESGAFAAGFSESFASIAQAFVAAPLAGGSSEPSSRVSAPPVSASCSFLPQFAAAGDSAPQSAASSNRRYFIFGPGAPASASARPPSLEAEARGSKGKHTACLGKSCDITDYCEDEEEIRLAAGGQGEFVEVRKGETGWEFSRPPPGRPSQWFSEGAFSSGPPAASAWASEPSPAWLGQFRQGVRRPSQEARRRRPSQEACASWASESTAWFSQGSQRRSPSQEASGPWASEPSPFFTQWSKRRSASQEGL